MEQRVISVIVPIYKVEQYLRQCVDSILNQTHRALEVILVDDGSPDGSGKICDEYAARDSRVRVIHKENGGLSDARNAGIDIARGDYIAFVDSDDWLEPDTYESMLAAMEKYQAKLVCAGRFDNSDETGACTVGLCPEKEELLPGGGRWCGRFSTGIIWMPPPGISCTPGSCSGRFAIRWAG